MLILVVPEVISWVVDICQRRLTLCLDFERNKRGAVDENSVSSRSQEKWNVLVSEL